MPALSVDVQTMPNIIEAQLTFSYARLSEIIRLIVNQGNAHDDELHVLRARIEALERDNASLHEQLAAQSALESEKAEQDRAMQQVIQNLWDEMGKLQAGYKEVQVEQDTRAREQRMQKDASTAEAEALRKQLDQQLRKTQEELKRLSSTTAVLYAFYGLWGPDDSTVLTLGARHGKGATSPARVGGMPSSSVSTTASGGGKTIVPPSKANGGISSPTKKEVVLPSRPGGGKGGPSGVDPHREGGPKTSSSQPPPFSEVGGGTLQHESGASVTVDGEFEHSLEARTDYVVGLPAFAHWMAPLDVPRGLPLHSSSSTPTKTTATAAPTTTTIATSPLHASASLGPAPSTSTSSLLPTLPSGNHHGNTSTTSSSGSTAVLRPRRSSMVAALGEGGESGPAKGLDPASAERMERLEVAVKELEDGFNGVLLLASHFANLEEVVDGMQSRSDAMLGGAGKFSSPVPTPASSGAGLFTSPPAGTAAGGGGTTTPKWTPTRPRGPSGEGGAVRGRQTSSPALFPPIGRANTKESVGESGTSAIEEGTAAEKSSVASSDTNSTMTGKPQESMESGDYVSSTKGSESRSGGGMKPQLLVPSGHPEVENAARGGRPLAAGGWMSASGTGSGSTSGAIPEHLSIGSRSSSLFPTRYLYPPTRLSIADVTTDQPHVAMLRRAMAAAESDQPAPPSSHSGEGRGGDGGGSARMKSGGGGGLPMVVIPPPEEGLRRRVEFMEENMAMLELKKADRSEVSILEEALRQLLIHAALARGTPKEMEIQYPQMPAMGAIAPGRPLYVGASGSVPLRDGEKKTNATISVLGYEKGNGEDGGRKMA